MARCDFPTVYAIIKKHCIDCSATKQANLIPGMFYTFDDNSPTTFKAPQINRWITGKEPIVKEIAGFYSDQENREWLKDDLKQYVLRYIPDRGKLYGELYELILNDISISETKRKEILKKRAADKLDFLAEVVFLSISRKPENMLAPKSPSALVEERIIDGDVPKPCKFFCGRDKELEDLHSLLSEHNKIFITGIAGIGKSEFVKAYAKQYKSEYTNILYYRYNDSLQRLISDIGFTDDMPDEGEEAKFKKHNRFLRALKEDSLIIIDNFNTTASDEQQLEVLLKYKCRIIFTTRSKFECGYTYELKEIESVDTLVDLFGKFYTETENCRDTVVDIIETVYHHTFIVELAARHLQKGLIEPDELLEKLKESSVDPHTSDKIKILKDGINFKDTYYNHLHTLFSLFLLSEQMQVIMRCMVFVPKKGIIAKTLAKWCVLPDLNEINDLIELGYISEDDAGAIMLLPVIKDIVIADLKPSCVSCVEFMRSIFTICLQIGIDVANKEMIFDVIENITRYAVIDNISDYLLFLQNAFSFMEKYEYERGMRLIIIKMEFVLSYAIVGNNNARALLFNAQASCERLFSKNNAKALELCGKALELCNPETDLLLAANINMNIGVLLDELGGTKAAKDSMERAVEYARKANVLNNNMVIMARNYARILSKNGDVEKAKTNLRNTIGELKASGFDKTIDYADLNLELGYITIRQRQVEEANVCFIRAFRIYNERLDKDKLEKIALSVQGCYKAAGVMDKPNCLAIT